MFIVVAVRFTAAALSARLRLYFSKTSSQEDTNLDLPLLLGEAGTLGAQLKHTVHCCKRVALIATPPCLLAATIVSGVRWIQWSRLQWFRTECDLVIAHCDENISWALQGAHKYRRVSLYSKCNTTLPLALPSNMRVHHLPNIGSCDFAYLTHISRNYASLPELTLFCKGGATYANCNPNFVQRPRFWLFEPPPYAYARPFGLVSVRNLETYVRPPMWSWFHSQFGFRRQAADSYHLTKWQFTNHKSRRASNRFVPSGFSNMTSWLYHTLGVNLSLWMLDRHHSIRYGGTFAAERANILRYPLSLYEAMRLQQRHANEEVDHFIERTWGLLLTTPVVPCHLLEQTL